MVEQRLKILRSMVAADSSNPGYRNRYWTNVTSEAYRELHKMAQLGLVVPGEKVSTMSGVMQLFCATRCGCIEAGLVGDQIDLAMEEH